MKKQIVLDKICSKDKNEFMQPMYGWGKLDCIHWYTEIAKNESTLVGELDKWWPSLVIQFENAICLSMRSILLHI